MSNFRADLTDEEIKKYTLRFLRHAIALIEAGEANGAVLVLTNKHGTARDWAATPHSRVISGDVAHTLRGYVSFFFDQWAAHAAKELPADLDAKPLVCVEPEPEES